jgi:enoyl-CoA hydratase/carnithine racemase
MHSETPQNTQEAVELGLYLAITADTDEKSADALQLAKELALDLSPAEMEDAKANVRKFIADERLRSQMMKSAKKPKRA